MLKQRVAKLNAHVEKCFDLLLVAQKNYSILRPMMDDVKLLDRTSRESKGAGFDTIRSVLYWNLVQELVKIVADKCEHVPSIHNFRENLASPEVKAHLKEKYSVWSSPAKDSDPVEVKELWKQINKPEEEWRRQSFDSLYEKAMKESEELLSSTALASMKMIRDKFLAHNELKLCNGSYQFIEIESYGFKYGHERAVLEKTTQVFDGIFVLVRRTYFDWAAFKALTESDAKEFWKK